MAEIVISTIIGALLIGIVVFCLTTRFLDRNYEPVIKSLIRERDRYQDYYSLANQWILLKQQGISLSGYFLENKMHRIAIYGLTELGSRLFDELNDTGIEVAFAVDKGNFCCPIPDLLMYHPNELAQLENSDDIDVLVVTPITSYERIREEMSRIVSCPIVSLKTVIDES